MSLAELILNLFSYNPNTLTADGLKVVHELFDDEAADPFQGDSDNSFFHFAKPTPNSNLGPSPSSEKGLSSADTLDKVGVVDPRGNRSESAQQYLLSIVSQTETALDETPADASKAPETSESAAGPKKESNVDLELAYIASEKTDTMSDADPAAPTITQVALKEESSTPPPAPPSTSSASTDLDKYKTKDENFDLWCTSRWT